MHLLDTREDPFYLTKMLNIKRLTSPAAVVYLYTKKSKLTYLYKKTYTSTKLGTKKKGLLLH